MYHTVFSATNTAAGTHLPFHTDPRRMKGWVKIDTGVKMQ